MIFSVYSTSCSSHDKCVDLKAKKIVLDPSDLGATQDRLFKLRDCGFDTADCRLAMMLVAQLTMTYSATNVLTNEVTMTYGEFIEKLNSFKQTPLYKEAREDIKQMQ